MKRSRAQRERVALARLGVDFSAGRRLHAEPGSLHIQIVIQRLVILIHVDRCARRRLQFRRAANVIDVRMSNHDRLHREQMPPQYGLNVVNIVAGIDHNGFTRFFVTEYGAIAMKDTHGKNLMNHKVDCSGPVYSGYVDLPRMSGGYVALREGAAWLDLSGRGKIRVSGADRARLLHAMTTNHIEQLKPGEGCYTFFLNAQGRILGDANVLCLEDQILLDTEPETRQKLFEHLDRYIIADDVTLDDTTDRLSTIAVEGPQAAQMLAELGAPLSEKPYSSTEWGARTVARLNSTGSDGYFLFVRAEEKADLLEHLEKAGAIAATPDDARIVRIEHGRARYGEEITERYLVQETDQLHAVHFSKGCYLGQEIVERVRSRAQIHRVLRAIQIDSPEAPAPGTKLTAGEAPAGEIASAVYSPAFGKVVALAYVRVPYSEPGAQIAIGDLAVRVS
jgi:folate-binding protein YgfZ